jgi:hypothetical protein
VLDACGEVSALAGAALVRDGHDPAAERLERGAAGWREEVGHRDERTPAADQAQPRVPSPARVLSRRVTPCNER